MSPEQRSPFHREALATISAMQIGAPFVLRRHCAGATLNCARLNVGMMAAARRLRANAERDCGATRLRSRRSKQDRGLYCGET
jgi:hypothetical protein